MFQCVAPRSESGLVSWKPALRLSLQQWLKWIEILKFITFIIVSTFSVKEKKNSMAVTYWDSVQFHSSAAYHLCPLSTGYLGEELP